ncbi:hypothetical protein yc1106_04616 [Curvularia clavata]|uniref:Zn(2)-C6 fungal-type domain-containing protein n=1 Tax=Curvularia clavata TaxID=95742 RepID=A0A9Q8Z860_CURCL|nr:hypothetical protein yc1106_04616 [Curvularia clavata]
MNPLAKTNDSASAAATSSASSRPAASARTASGGPKVRDCCQACAKSKVRCTKERPTCSRCESKGIECRYLHCRRPGRVPGSGARRANPPQPADRPKSQVAGAPAAGKPLRLPTSPSPSPHDSSSTADHGIASLLLSPVSTTQPPDQTPVCNTNTHHRVDSFQTHSSASDVLASDLFPALTFDSSHPSYGVWDDCLDTLAGLDAPSYPQLMDWDPSATAMSGNLSLDSGLGLDMFDSASTSGPQSPASRLLPPDVLMSSASTFSTEPSSRASSSESLSSSSSASSSASTVPTSLSSASSSSSRHPSLPRDVMALPALPSSQSCGQSMHPEGAHSTVSKGGNGTNCNCLDQALDLFKAVTKDPCSDASSASGSPLTQVILSKNKETIQAMLALVNCSNCSNDRLLIAVALLITMKMLSWYASAAALTGGSGPGHSIEDVSRASSSGHSSPVSGTSAAPGRDQQCHRQAKQQVLRELHSVQRLITSLSARLKGLESDNTGTTANTRLSQLYAASREPERSFDGRKRMAHAMPFQPGVVDTALMPISTRTLEAVEVDARSSLGFLSAVVRNALKES